MSIDVLTHLVRKKRKVPSQADISSFGRTEWMGCLHCIETQNHTFSLDRQRAVQCFPGFQSFFPREVAFKRPEIRKIIELEVRSLV